MIPSLNEALVKSVHSYFPKPIVFRLIFLTFITSIAFCNANSTEHSKIDCSTALNTILGISNLSNDEIRYCETLFLPGDSIPYVRGVEVINTSCWLVCVNETPLSNRIDSILYYFVDAETGNYHMKRLKGFPSVPNMRQGHMPDNLLATQSLQSRAPIQLPSTINNPNYAIIISGGYNPQNNYMRYWNDCAAVFDMLKNQYGYQQSRIYVLMADGTSPNADYWNPYQGRYCSSPIDLDGDGVTDITSPATRAAISSAITDIAQQINEDEDLFIFTIDHGERRGNHSLLCLWNEETLFDYELTSLLSEIRARNMTIVMGQCNSGGFIDYLAADNRVIMTACASNEFSYASPDGIRDEFVKRWTDAMSAYLGDLDGDSEISMHEAFLYALEHDISAIAGQESPQYGCSTLLGDLAKLSPNFPEITGENVFCTSSCFSVENTIPDCSYFWGYGSERMSSVVPHFYIESNGATAIYRQGVMLDVPIVALPSINSMSLLTVPFFGDDSIYARIRRGGKDYVLHKTVSIPNTLTPSIVTNMPRILRGLPITFRDTICLNISDSDLEWNVVLPDNNVLTGTGHSITVTPSTVGTIFVTLTNYSGCNSPKSITRSFRVLNNPVISVQDTGDAYLLTNSCKNDPVAFSSSLIEVFLYDSYGVLNKHIVSDDDIVISKSSLSTGIYYLVAYNKARTERTTISIIIK